MFACNVDGVEMWAEGENDGRQVHLGFDSLRVAIVGEREAAILTERLRWLNAAGRALLDETWILTVFTADGRSGQALPWESYLSPAPGRSSITLSGRPYHGLGMRFVREMDAGGRFFSARGSGVDGTNGHRAEWCAYAAEAAPGRPVTVAILDPATRRSDSADPAIRHSTHTGRHRQIWGVDLMAKRPPCSASQDTTSPENL